MALKFRRGTTAQKSGSLAVGEPYINYDLQTLQIGTDQGDVTLSTTSPTATSAVASLSASNFISSSYLHVVNDATIKGNVTIGGTIQIGDQSSDVVNVVASLSSSLIPETDNTFDLGSLTKSWRDLYISTGSIKMVSNGVVVSTLSNTANGFTLDQGVVARGDSSFGTSSAAVTSVTGSLRVSGSASVIGALSASTITGIGNVSLYSTSVDSRLVAAEAFSSSLDSTFATDASVTIISASAWGAFQSASSYSASAATALSSVSGAVATSISASDAEYTAFSASAASTYAVKGAANTFTGTQTITGSVYVSGDLIVQGSSSLQNITASAVSIGTNKVILNTDNPAVRYGGISVIDSGSSHATGSLLWDSQNNVWLYQNPEGAGYASALLIAGPKNTGSLGNETGLTVGQVPVAVGDDHIGNSIISASAAKVSIAGDLDVTGNISASTITGIGNVTAYSTSVDSRISSSLFSCFASSININGVNVSLGGTLTQAQTINGAYSSSAQVDHNATTNYVANKHIDHTTVSISAGNGMSGGGDISSTRTLTLDTASAHFVSGARAGLSVVDTTGASGIDLTYNAGLGTLSGVLANSSVTINGSSVSLGGSLTTAQVLAGAFSSSAQVDLTATTNYGTYINQAVKTTSSPTFAGLTINGSITATGDITAYYTSDRRFKDNVQTIPNALEKVKALNGVTWDWAESASDVTKAAPTTGLIAQEVQEVLPQVVKEKEDGFLGLDYSKMIGLLVEAIKEQQYKIDTLQAELEGIKNSNN